MEDYAAMKDHFTSMEWVISEMELKVNTLRLTQPKFDFEDSMMKINALKKAQSFIYESFESSQNLLKKIYELEFTNKKLLAENITKTKP